MLKHGQYNTGDVEEVVVLTSQYTLYPDPVRAIVGQMSTISNGAHKIGKIL